MDEPLDPLPEGPELNLTGSLSIKVIRNDGAVEDLGVVSEDEPLTPMAQEEFRALYNAQYNCARGWGFWKRLLMAPLLAFFCAFGLIFGLVTTAGVNYMAADFLASSTNHIAAFNQHDSGTGTTAAATTDTTLQTPTGGARVAGTQSNPSSGVYQTVATIPYTSSLAITEWGVFSASSSGTLWDRRVFSAVNVVSGNSIQFTYAVTVNAGGT